MKIGFQSLTGFFYDHGIGDTKIIDKEKSLMLYYLSSINKFESENLDSVYQILNVIIAKYLLSIRYYKDVLNVIFDFAYIED